MVSGTPFSHLTDDEYLHHLYNKDRPTAEDIESALRLELMLNDYRSLLEQIHLLSQQGLADDNAAHDLMIRIRDITAPAVPETAYVQ